jgi:hypothetical protein
MAAINTTTESWTNHTHQEVETHIKNTYLKSSDGSVNNILVLTETAYTNLTTKDSKTLYIVVAD